MRRLGVIDLGTNTFHLLIVETKTGGTFEEIYRQRIFIKLAENGIDRIGQAPFQRGLKALHTYQQVLEEYQVDEVKAFGTAALRTASNGREFIKEVKEKTGLTVQLIQGSEEAEYIYKGVVQAVPFDQGKGLIMDIGGGSVEFIIADQKQFYWAQSFPIGVAVLYNRFHQNDPIHPTEIEAMEVFLGQELRPLFDQLQHHDIHQLIGASGTFDVVQDLLADKSTPLFSQVSVAEFYPFYDQMLKSSLQERLDHPNIPDTRADMIIVALILIHFMLTRANIQTILTSAYAMKEGMLYDMIQESQNHFLD
ncbi:MAG: exopolyphosphatase [Bacteroidota bacterium]